MAGLGTRNSRVLGQLCQYSMVHVPNDLVRFLWEFWGLGDLHIEVWHLVLAGNSRL
jgi:hypothetical protein